MRSILSGMCTLVMLLAIAALGRGDDADTVRAILDKGIKALGGEGTVTKFPAMAMKGKGVFYEKDMKTPFSGVWYTQGLNKARTTTTVEIKTVKSIETRVVNGDKGWIKEFGEDTKPMDNVALADEKADLYFNYVTTLVPLKGKEFKVAPLADIKVNDKPAVGISVSQKGQKDVKLYFDKESGLLVKAERKVRDAEAKKEVTEEVIFSDYKEVDGLKIAMKFNSKRDGKPYADAEMTEAKPQEKLDEKLFEKP
ncbi:MAG: hypothetical protein K2R98_07150 [Gemmataceae bacterium]|nr:hypothetical protein [Gemmataceae bacterium]